MSSARGGSQSSGRGAVWASLFLILIATLSPGNWSEWGGHAQVWDGGLADILINVALFAPFGAALSRRGRTASGALLVGAVLASVVEIAQLGVPGRVASLTDVLSDTVGTVAGWVLWRTHLAWVGPKREVAGRLALAAACIVAAIVGVTGALLAPSFPSTRYFGGWTHEFGHLSVYHGQVLDASVGGTVIPSGPVLHSAELRRRLIGRETLEVRAVAGPPVAALAPLLSIHDEHQQEILLLGADKEDLVYRFRTRAAALGLDSPDLRLEGVLRGIHPGTPMMVVVSPQGAGYCIDVSGTSTCGIGFTAGMGWGLLLFHQLPPWTHGLLNVLWVAGLMFPLGYWARARWECGLAVAMVAAALLLLPSTIGLVRTPPQELAAALVGLFAGLMVQVLPAVRRAQPDEASTRCSPSRPEPATFNAPRNTARRR